MVFKISKKVDLVLFLFFIFVYLFFASNFKFKFNTSRFNYYNYLAEAFLHSKTYFISQPPQLLDLSIYQNKIYLYFAPVPAIIFMPFVAIFGRDFSDVFLTALIGGFSCFVFYKLLQELKKTNLLQLKITDRTIVLMSLLFAFGTNHFYLSLFGGVWYTAHIFAVFFLNLSLYFLFKTINIYKNCYILLSAIFYCLACLSRLSMLFMIVFIFFILIRYIVINKKQSLKQLKFFFIPTIIIFSLYLIYNYFRFNSLLNVGYQSQIYSSVNEFNVKNYGRLNPIYLILNAYYFLLHPYKIIGKFPFYLPYHNGNSIFLVSPIFLLIFINWKKGVNLIKKNLMLYLAMCLSMLFILFTDLLNFSPGGPQIGYRYSLDFLSLLLIFLIPFVNNFKSKVSLILLLLCFYIGFTSVYIFKYQMLEFW